MSIRHTRYGAGDVNSLASRLRHRITFQEPNDTADGAGGVTRGWSDVATVWAEVIPLRSGNDESLLDAEMQGTTRLRITTRYRDGITTAMRIVFGTRLFNIRSVVNAEEASVILEITAEEGVAS